MKLKPPSPAVTTIVGAVAGLAAAIAGVFLLWGLGWALLLGGAAVAALSMTVDV